jgi:hypothetical protein
VLELRSLVQLALARAGSIFGPSALLLLGACTPGPGQPAVKSTAAPERAAIASSALRLDYRVRLDAELRGIDVRVCFEGDPGKTLASGFEGAASALQGAWLEPAAGAAQDRPPLLVVDRHIDLTGVPPGACVGYRIDLLAAESGLRLAVERRGEAIATNVALWLWRPERWRAVADSTATLELPDGTRASLPWPRQGDHYRLPQSALAFYAFGAFGRFELERFETGGATLEVAVLPGLSPSTRQHVVPWLKTAAELASQPLGRFPRTSAHVVVIPSAAGDEPVRFAMLGRGGGASVVSLLASDAERQALLDDWVAVHEFCHMLHPFLERRDAWLSEGLATYYQEVLRARTGHQPEATAWRRIHDGAALGRAAHDTLEQASAEMFQTSNFRTVYWGGAAFALLADLELRKSSAGQRSLDDVLGALAGEVAAQQATQPAGRLIARMDEIAGAPIVSGLFERWVTGPRFPDLTDAYRELGVRVDDGKVQIDPAAPQASIRAAIMGSQGE